MGNGSGRQMRMGRSARGRSLIAASVEDVLRSVSATPVPVPDKTRAIVTIAVTIAEIDNAG
jgi:hypothetical protein